jgi:CubicO group peptidase (beta-lactamase class C family)
MEDLSMTHSQCATGAVRRYVLPLLVCGWTATSASFAHAGDVMGANALQLSPRLGRLDDLKLRAAPSNQALPGAAPGATGANALQLSPGLARARTALEQRAAQAAAPAAPGAAPPPEPCPTPPASAPPPQAFPSNALPYRPFPAAWQAVLDKMVSDKTVPGALVIVKSPIWGVRLGTAGLSEITTQTPMSPGQQFRIGSVSKVFTGQTVLSLEQEGRLKLTDPVLKFLGDDPVVKDIPDIENETVADLLQMKSGITNYLTEDILVSVRTNPSIHYSPDQLMRVLGKSASPTIPPDFAPGQTYSDPYWWELFKPLGVSEPAPYPYWYYSNSNYVLLGMIIEKITGMPAADAIKQYVIDRAGMRDTFFATDEKPTPAMRGYTHLDALGGTKIYNDWCDVTGTNPSYAWTAGAVVSTPWDLLQLLETMFRTERLLNAGTKDKWYSFASSDIHLGWAPTEYGTGALMQAHRAYGDFRGHGGAYPGYKTLIYYFPDAQTSFVLASNTWDQTGPVAPEVAMLESIMTLVKSAVTTPSPQNSDRYGAPGKVRLSWQAGRVYGDGYNIYLGTNADQVDSASMGSHPGVTLHHSYGNSIEVDALQPRETYFWRVDTVAGDRIISGPLWRFTTERP